MKNAANANKSTNSEKASNACQRGRFVD